MAGLVRAGPEGQAEAAEQSEPTGDGSFKSLVQQARTSLSDSEALLQKQRP